MILSLAALLATCVAILGGRTRRPSGLLSTFMRLAPRETEENSSGLPLLVGIGGVTALVVAGALFVWKRG